MMPAPEPGLPPLPRSPKTSKFRLPCRPQIHTCKPTRAGYWKAGITSGNHGLKPAINGEPDPLIFEADESAGWAKRYIPRPSIGHEDEDGMIIIGEEKIHGTIRLLPGDVDVAHDPVVFSFVGRVQRRPVLSQMTTALDPTAP